MVIAITAGIWLIVTLFICVLSTGLFFSDWIKEHRLVHIVTGCLAILSSIMSLLGSSMWLKSQFESSERVFSLIEMKKPKNKLTIHTTEGLRQTTLSSFLIGNFEVTVGEFREFVNAENFSYSEGCKIWNNKKKEYEFNANKYWDDPGFLQTDNHPVVCVNEQDIKAYLEFQNVRLPNEAEWEFALRGQRDEQYITVPEDANCSDCNFWWTQLISGKKTMPVGNFTPDHNQLYDLNGNVSELVEQQNGVEYRFAIRGGSWADAYETSFKVGYIANHDASIGTNTVGFRTVADPI